MTAKKSLSHIHPDCSFDVIKTFEFMLKLMIYLLKRI